MIQILVLAKAPVPGRVKTRLCPPCTPREAATIAAAALADTLDAAREVAAVRHTLVLDGEHPVPPGWSGVPQRGAGLGERLANAFEDAAVPGVPSLLIGMDTPQVTPALLAAAADTLCRENAVLGLAADGGWWALGLADPDAARVLPDVPMSTAVTGERTLAALHGRGLRPVLLPLLRDVDTAADAIAVAGDCPDGNRFPAAVDRVLATVGRPERGAGGMTAVGARSEGRVA
ncbi:DUF2064 domain-containing protein [Actinoplanes sp. NPDC024001]|uniref:TIGR04282 family arsenosugar biosynthesis glycosyltransferase n=1 Tax=Actinoplanes sp. NPDC024001 TaxID=3154598 RepID=UPI0033D170D7